MFKEWLKQFIAMCICVITILSSFSPAFAEDYVANDKGDDGATYYIIDGKDVDKLFDFGIWDVDNIADWIFNFKTYTVIKKYSDDGGTQYKMYFNTPNLQSILKNRVISLIDDGYTDNTYKVEDTEWVVDVGMDVTNENVITKYGFQIPCYTYFGEYPKEVMSTAGILPAKKWYAVIWRAIKSIFGASFIKAPDADNFNTITYMNHTYSDKNDYILEFFKDYYLTWFERKIPLEYCANGDEYFTGPEQVIELAVTEDAYNKASEYNKEHKDEYEMALDMEALWKVYEEKGAIDPYVLEITDPRVGNREYDPAHYLASCERYRNAFTAWVNSHPRAAYILALAIKDVPDRKRYGGSGATMTDPWSYRLTETEFDESDYEESISLAADIGRYAEDNLMAHVSYDLVVYEIEYYDDGTNSGVYEVSRTHVDTEMPLKDAEALKENPDSGYTLISAGPPTWVYQKTVYENFEIVDVFAPSDPENTMSYESWEYFRDTFDFDNFGFEYNDFVPLDYQAIKTSYEKNDELINNYKLFILLLSHGADQDSSTKKEELLYRQCMITNEGKDKECWSRKYSDDKTSLTMINVYAFSRIWEVTKDVPESTTKLTNSQAHEIISKIQAYCGPYSDDVIGNMMKLMCATANAAGDTSPMNRVMADDKRVMPYDTSSLLAVDRANYDTIDPRVDLYKSHVIGKLVSRFQLSFAIGIYFKPQKTIINVAGRITEISVFMQQLCNFDVLDGYGLSPATLWSGKYAYVGLMMGLLALFFILKTCMAIFKLGTNAGWKIVVAFLLLLLELGLIVAVAAKPKEVWTNIKNAEMKLMNLGEMVTVYSIPDLAYLYGDASDMEVTYYMPYLDIWSKYNTGYGILKPEQTIDSSRDYRELVDKDFPKVGSTEVKHWSVLLMDSFHYWGYSNSLSNTITIDGKTYNGNVINNNAYRVIDHLMAPRVNISDSGDSISITVTQNENYNGELQSGLLDVIVKLLNCCLCCLLSLIKFLTFMWQWWVFYIFIFRVILGRGAEGKTRLEIFIETFSPLLALIFIGMYTGMVMIMGMEAEGVVGICLELFLFWLTFMLLRAWHDLGKHRLFFPGTLVWLYLLTNLSEANRRRLAEKRRREEEADAYKAGLDDDWAKKSLDEQREEMFDESGNLKPEFANDPNRQAVIMDWYQHAYATQHARNGAVLSNESYRAMRTLESMDKYKEEIKNRQTRISKEEKLGKDDNNNSSPNNHSNTPGAHTDTLNNDSNNSNNKTKPKSRSSYDDDETKVNTSDRPIDKPVDLSEDDIDDSGRVATGSGEDASERRKGSKKIGSDTEN